MKRRRHPKCTLVSFLIAAVPLCWCGPANAGDITPGLDRIAFAVDGAESSHARNPAMWRLNPGAPQGPMQVSGRAGDDVGGGDRFDIAENRVMGRAYLALLYRRYGNWPDAVAAYNWGMGNLDGWIRAGRPSQRLSPGVARYLSRVLHDSGLSVTGLERLSWSSQGAPFGRNGYRLFVHNDSGLRLRGLEESGRPLPVLTNSGRPLPGLAQSGRPLPNAVASGRSLPSLAHSGQML